MRNSTDTAGLNRKALVILESDELHGHPFQFIQNAFLELLDIKLRIRFHHAMAAHPPVTTFGCKISKVQGEIAVVDKICSQMPLQK